MTKREAAVIMAYTGFVTLKGKDLKYFAEYASKLLGYPVYTHDFGVPSVMDELHEKSKNDFLDICNNIVDTRGEDPLICAYWEAKQLNMKLTVRCGNDDIRVGDVNQSFKICKLIETAMGREKEGAEKE